MPSLNQTEALDDSFHRWYRLNHAVLLRQDSWQSPHTRVQEKACMCP